MPVNYRVFVEPSGTVRAILTQSALKHMYAHAQRQFWHKEAGGEIYTPTPFESPLLITDAFGPNRLDMRSRRHFNPKPEVTTHVRAEQFARGKHAVGLWHTHPERSPRPSIDDAVVTHQFLEAFGLERDFYLLVIIGCTGIEPEIYVGMARRMQPKTMLQLTEA